MSQFLPPLIGGALIGLAASLLLLFNGRVAGIVGIVSGLLGPDAPWRALFVAGLISGGALVALFRPAWVRAGSNLPAAALILSGLLVGYGTRLGSGCTSGHGVCGISRLSGRSIAATAVFMLVGAVAVFVTRHVLGVAS